MDGRNCRKRSQQSFPYPVFGRFTYTRFALVRHYPRDLVIGEVFEVVSAHIKQSVREQPDTGYWKSLLTSFAADPSWFLGAVG